ncbi:MAG: SdrD B-like domain-containing protein [Tepidisphaeraceae bacterium]
MMNWPNRMSRGASVIPASSGARRKRRSALHRAALEALESRTMLTLLGINPPLPKTAYDSVSSLSYTAANGEFDVVAIPQRLYLTIFNFKTYSADATLTMHAILDHAGNLIGGVSGADFTLTGTVQYDTQGDTASGTLLTGKIVAFGWLAAIYPVAATYDARFVPTGGLLQSMWSGQDIGVTISSDAFTDSNNVIEGPIFTGDFTHDFKGQAKGVVGTTPPGGSLSGFVYDDQNKNGVFDAVNGDTGIGGSVVTLTGTDSRGYPVNETTTSASDGSYSFSDLNAGTYTITHDEPSGYVDGTDNPGSLGGVASHDKLASINLPFGANGINYNFGEQTPTHLLSVAIGDYVWNDANANGIQDSGESGIPGVKLTLTGTDGNGNPVTDHATTDSNGKYLFTELTGSYTVTVDAVNPALSGFTATTVNAPGSTTDNDSNANPTGSLGSQTDLSVDFGFYQPVTIGNFVWNDLATSSGTT